MVEDFHTSLVNSLTLANISVSVSACQILLSFTIGMGGEVYSVTVQADGKIFLGGSFTEVGDNMHYCIARLNPDGSEDTSFTIGTNLWVRCLATQYLLQ
jgi:hypothetical protein